MAALKCKLHDASAREQQLMIAAQLAEVEVTEEGGLFPVIKDAKTCAAHIVRLLHCKPVHYTIGCLIVIDVILIAGTLQCQMESLALEVVAFGTCLSEALASPNHTVVDGCVEEQPEYKTAETLEEVEHIFGYIGIGILSVFLIENILFILAFGRNYFKVFFYPLDLAVTLLSLASEIISFAMVQSDPRVQAVKNDSSAATTNLVNRGSVTQGISFPLVGFVILARFWRFFRIGHVVYFLKEEKDAEDEVEDAGKKKKEPSKGEQDA